MNNLELNGKVIVVAGAGGIGAATAKVLNEHGAKIVLIDISEDSIKQCLAHLQGENAGYTCDFSDVESIEAVIKQVVKENGAVSGFAHCVGTGAVRPLKMSKYSYMQNVMNINFFSFVEIVRCLSAKGAYAADGMNVVGVSAIGAFLGNSTKTAYCASKAAMNAASRCMAKELAPKGIRVNTVAPGVTDTPMARATEEYGKDSDEHKAILERQYLGICQPEDIANAILFLMGNLSRMITGSCITVDGGKSSS